ncbi:2,4-dienoyl-CoA reductase-like NADH-dependent reductase (Old Yellow Enzyme family) [Roseiarcus fermentans]|uniref:2,4-dienoyl-CoA reductase-like NADH-dependent reductase (Old Yellow Enzyme family) n=1 Tax=Roseiarcus fermentans TaxID=1473586 RepID=A0A366EKH6_9HYPH|nr:NADH:flavin oxidoreductase [Roseiarcus fermentans]RBP02220.1 2,4-dienoyl-CoA reductase-like NADH-dependent reductase (Old Yellow Enzyme family) [Roseiarcus fermentans]
MKLFEPLTINGMTLPNRIMVPAMVTHLCREDGLVNQDIVDRYVAYAEGGVGLIVVEAMAIHTNKSGSLLRVSDDQFIPGLRELTKRIHGASDSKVVPQIIHFMKVAKTGWRQTIDTLSSEQIEEIIDQFGAAAGRVREAGFDGLELHSAHAYTLSSFLSRTNPRTDEYGGTTLEGRLRLIGRVMKSVRRRVGVEFPVCVRLNAEEFIKNGYTVDESKLIAQRFSELGFDYLSLSVGGKFEDAVHTPGQVLFPYSGYSGDRCMPGAWLPRALHVNLAAEIKAHLVAHGCSSPVAIAGKLSDPADAERVLTSGSADIVGIARGLLADPAWPNKVRSGRTADIVQCDYCNVCKQLDGTHKPVICNLWPRGSLQAARDEPAAAPAFEGSDKIVATATSSQVSLSWNKVPGATLFDVYRSTGSDPANLVEATKLTNWTDTTVIGGKQYTYQVRAHAADGHASASALSAKVDVPMPDYLS